MAENTDFYVKTTAANKLKFETASGAAVIETSIPKGMCLVRAVNEMLKFAGYEVQIVPVNASSAIKE